MQYSGTADIAFEHQRHSSKSRLLKMSGRESIRRKEISDFWIPILRLRLGRQSAFCLWGLEIPSLPLTRLIGFGVCGGSFELPKTACLGSLDCTLRNFNTVLLSCKDILSCSSTCYEPALLCFFLSPCVYGLPVLETLYKLIPRCVLERSFHRDAGRGASPRARSRVASAFFLGPLLSSTKYT